MPTIGAFGSTGADWVITEDTYNRLGFSEDSLAVSEMSMKMMKLFSYGLTGLVALISFMNMANTMIRDGSAPLFYFRNILKSLFFQGVSG